MFHDLVPEFLSISLIIILRKIAADMREMVLQSSLRALSIKAIF